MSRRIRMARCRGSFRTYAIDACMEGWIPGVTREDDGLGRFRALDDATSHEEHIVELTRADLENWRLREEKQGWAIRPGPADLVRLDGSHGFPRAIYQVGGFAYELWDICRTDLALAMRDPRPALDPDVNRIQSAQTREFQDLLAQSQRKAVTYITGLSEAFGRMSQNRRRDGTKPPVFVEGGLHLVSRCVAEVAKNFGHPVIALESCWIPGHFLACDQETGAAVNRWNLLAPDLMLADPADSEMIERFELACQPAFAPDITPNGALPELPEKGRLSFLILGQVPWDASIVDCYEPELPETIAFDLVLAARKGPIQIRFRPHPLELASKLDGTTTWDRVQEAVETARRCRGAQKDVELVQTGGVPWPNELREFELAGGAAVCTVNSQAGWMAARKVPTFVWGSRCFYGRYAPLVRRPHVLWRLLHDGVRNYNSLSPEQREARWLAAGAEMYDRFYWRADEDVAAVEEILARRRP